MTRETKMISGAAICVLLLLIGVSFAIAGEAPPQETVYDLYSPENEATASDVPVSTGYVVQSDGSDVYVYSQDGRKLMSLDILPAKLREADAKKIAEGIEVRDDEALWRLIEDFSS